MAASEEREEAGSDEYQDKHFNKILKEGFSFSGFERDHLWWNDGNGRFVDISGLSGLDSPTDGRGAAYGDLDNDGDMDIVRTSFQGRTHMLYRNNVGADYGFLRVDLVGTKSGRDAFGAQVRVQTPRGTQTRQKSGGTGYVSAGDPRLLFGLASDEVVDEVEVRWPSGTIQTFGPFPTRTSIRLTEGTDAAEVLSEEAFTLPDPANAEASMLSMLRVKKGDRFPDLDLIRADAGTTTFFEAATGALTLVNFWATWCVPCRREMPALEILNAELDAIDVIGISLDTGPSRRNVTRTARKLGVSYPIFTTEEPAYPHIFSGEEVFIPLSFVVDGDGTVVEIISGWSDAAEARVRELTR